MEYLSKFGSFVGYINIAKFSNSILGAYGIYRSLYINIIHIYIIIHIYYNIYIYIYIQNKNIQYKYIYIYYTIYMYKIYPSLSSSLSLSFPPSLLYDFNTASLDLCGPRYLYFRSLKWHWHLLVMTLRVLPRRGQKPHVCSLTHTHILIY